MLALPGAWLHTGWRQPLTIAEYRILVFVLDSHLLWILNSNFLMAICIETKLQQWHPMLTSPHNHNCVDSTWPQKSDFEIFTVERKEMNELSFPDISILSSVVGRSILHFYFLCLFWPPENSHLVRSGGMISSCYVCHISRPNMLSYLYRYLEFKFEFYFQMGGQSCHYQRLLQRHKESDKWVKTMVVVTVDMHWAVNKFSCITVMLIFGNLWFFRLMNRWY